MTRFIFVTGGVVSSLGKGIATASIGRLLRSRGLNVRLQKLDPYINVDADTMNPFQHGEAFVTDDGAVTDLDLGHYERFTNIALTRHSSVTTGSVYRDVIAAERRGDYDGATVQTIPHVTNAIKDRIRLVAKTGKNERKVDVVVAEVGGTVGDIEGLPFLEAIRQMRADVGLRNVMYIHVTLVPGVGPWDEQKTKPTQHSVIKLREIGIHPDMLICRSKRQMSDDMLRKISLFCDVPVCAVIPSVDTSTVYDVPLKLEVAGVAEQIVKRFGLRCDPPDLDAWQRIVRRITSNTRRVHVAVVGKYVDNSDAYISIREALHHAAAAADCNVMITWVNSRGLRSSDIAKAVNGANAMVVAPGFGVDGIEGKLHAVQHARVTGLPFLGICLGMQMAVVEFARNVAGIPDAESGEVDPATPNPVVHIMPEQRLRGNRGGTMRLGSRECQLAANSLASRLYGVETIRERHRHRYEVNNDYRARLIGAGMDCSGTSPDGKFVEIVEIPGHPFFIGCQFHPEFQSRPDLPHPLFVGLVKAALDRAEREAAGDAGRTHTAAAPADGVSNV
ncbi:MAG: CTP synthase [Armatimonadetes bacterium]|nr:CTP synthase [Armatimonadota bacterium]MDE2207287.1 CTP synthase [Armatimonadota bacterium]